MYRAHPLSPFQLIMSNRHFYTFGGSRCHLPPFSSNNNGYKQYLGLRYRTLRWAIYSEPERIRVMDLNELNLSDEQMDAVRKYVQSETDKVRTDYSTKLKNANDELSKYKPKEKSEQEKTLDERTKSLDEREKAIAEREKSLDLTKKLSEKGLPADLAKYLNVDDDEALTSISNLLLANGYVPKAHPKNNGITKEQFKKMNYMQKAKLFAENPELYKKLSK